jgi:hypothetical protein
MGGVSSSRQKKTRRDGVEGQGMKMPLLGGRQFYSLNAVSHPKFEEQGIDRESSGVRTR